MAYYIGKVVPWWITIEDSRVLPPFIILGDPSQKKHQGRSAPEAVQVLRLVTCCHACCSGCTRFPSRTGGGGVRVGDSPAWREPNVIFLGSTGCCSGKELVSFALILPSGNCADSVVVSGLRLVGGKYRNGQGLATVVTVRSFFRTTLHNQMCHKYINFVRFPCRIEDRFFCHSVSSIIILLKLSNSHSNSPELVLTF